MEESVRRHARQVQVPPDFQQLDLAMGMDHYQEMCVQCHGAPGVERGEIGRGLDPQPPQLQEAASDWTPAELYWIIRHGVRMTGMPAFGLTHTEPQLWAITALVSRLPKMTPAQYQALAKASSGTNETEHEHGHEEHGSE